MKYIKASLIGSLLVCSQMASATLIDTDSDSFIDSDTGLEWMDFGVNNNQSFEDVVAQLGVGGTYEGWILPSADQVYTMWANAFLGIATVGYENADEYGEGQLLVTSENVGESGGGDTGGGDTGGGDTGGGDTGGGDTGGGDTGGGDTGGGNTGGGGTGGGGCGIRCGGIKRRVAAPTNIDSEIFESELDQIFTLMGYNQLVSEDFADVQSAIGLFQGKDGTSRAIVTIINVLSDRTDNDIAFLAEEHLITDSIGSELSTMLIRGEQPLVEVSEPETLAIFMLGLAGLGLRRTRKVRS